MKTNFTKIDKFIPKTLYYFDANGQIEEVTIDEKEDMVSYLEEISKKIKVKFTLRNCEKLTFKKIVQVDVEGIHDGAAEIRTTSEYQNKEGGKIKVKQVTFLESKVRYYD
jgi:hypothetical protein